MCFTKDLQEFMDRTDINILQPADYEEQTAFYNRRMRDHTLKYETLTVHNGLIIHVYEPTDGCRDNWELYIRNRTKDGSAQF